MKKILFIIHEASETGAPLVILNLLESSYSNQYECFVLSLYGGKIENELRKKAKVSILNKKIKKSVFNKISNKMFNFENEFLKKAKDGFFDLVYVNSLACFSRLPNLDFLSNNKTILNVHEGPVLTENLNIHDAIVENILKFSSLIFVSEFAKESFNSKYNIEKSSQYVIPPVIRNLEEKQTDFKHLDVSDNSFIVSSSGSLNYTKGVDLFIQVAKLVIEKAKENNPIYFVWIGTNGNNEIRNHFFNDIKKIGLENKVIVMSNTTNIISCFRETDVFFLPSREESFSMVAMENAFLGNPVVCFDNGNGAIEFINNENGYVVPYLDTQAAANAILEMYNERSYLHEKSQAAKKMSANFSGDNSAKKIFEVIDRTINAN
ncbi:glycosyltransferase family 4 protein [Flavobacterium sp. YJ01]|uniref:glycosyltransferase family 4 protein n=1 Tax=unclassified Flavobacterium TaxID=196869 RepID=UPI0023E42B92|nr:glycosyltransferase family 4 protein [Flavobacterium sp. YJ01]WET01229.1 glycosyltransferase family 4 protein [Flavobacterium sp. YJ01]